MMLIEDVQHACGGLAPTNGNPSFPAKADATVCHSVSQCATVCHSVGAATCTSIQQLHQSALIHPQQDVHCILHNVQAAYCTLHMTGNQLPDSLQSTYTKDCHVHQMHWRAPNELECSANADIWVGKPPPMH